MAKPCPTEHFNKPSLARVAERCFKSSVKFNPTDLQNSGILRYQTNSMTFYQKLNIRQNTIEGNLLRRDQGDIERERIQNLRSIKRASIELRLDMRGYEEYYRGKMKRRKEAKQRRKEEKERKERELKQETETSSRSLSPQSLPATTTEKRKLVSRTCPSASGLQIQPDMMAELGLAGIEIPNVPASWGKVSRTVLNLHKNWAREKNQNRHRRAVSGKSDPGTRRRKEAEFEARISSPDKNRKSTKSHQSYFQSCLARPFSYEEFADRRVTCKENEDIWVKTLRDPYPPNYKRFVCSGEEKSIMQRQFSGRNIEKAQKDKVEFEARRPVIVGTDVNDRITRMKFTSTKMLEERAELDRRAQEGRLQTDRCIRRHKYMDKTVSVEDIVNQRPSYLRYRKISLPSGGPILEDLY